MDNRIFRLYPFLRPLLSLAGGIAAGYFTYDIGGFGPLISAYRPLLPYLFATLLAAMVGSFVMMRSHTHRWLFGTFLSLSLLLLGATTTISGLSRVHLALPSGSRIYTLRITDKAIEKQRTLMMHALLISRRDSDTTICYDSPPQLLLYIRKDSASRLLQMNDEITLRSTLTMPDANSLIGRNSYRNYLYRNGISAICYADSTDWHRSGHSPHLTLRQHAILLRSSILSLYRRLGFEGDNMAVLSALTLGYRDTLDKELQEQYSVAGVSHALAISGMHIAFLCGLLMLIMRIVPWRAAGVRLVKSLVAISLLWSYVFLIGMPVSAVRASMMFSLGLLIMTYRSSDKPTINILLITAFIMLMVRPLWLFEVGFQLSFLSVASILLFYPIVKQLYRPSSPLLRHLYDIIVVTFVAQLGTTPITLYYFYRIPTYSLIANPVVIMLLAPIVYGAIAMVVLTPLASLQWYVARGVDWLLSLLNGFVRQMSSLPHSSADNLYLRLFEVAALYIAIVALFRYISRRSGRRLLMLLAATTFVVGCRIQFAATHRPTNDILLYSCNGTPVIHCTAANGESWAIVPPSSTLRQSSFASFCARHSLKRLHIVADNYTDSHLSAVNLIVCYNGMRVALLCDGRWRRTAPHAALPLDCLYITSGFSLAIDSIPTLFAPRIIAADRNLSSLRSQEIAQFCRRQEIEYLEVANATSIKREE